MPAQPPYHAYATIVGTFLAGLGAVSGIAAARNRPLQEPGAIDLALLGLATFKAARVVSRDKVTSFVREPLVEGHAYDGEDEQPAQTGGMQQALGELVTCYPLRRHLARRRAWPRRRCWRRAPDAC